MHDVGNEMSGRLIGFFAGVGSVSSECSGRGSGGRVVLLFVVS